MKLGSLFDGSGGFPLAGALCGIEPVWASEVEPYPIAVTRERFPKMKHLGDISKINGAEIEPVDIITFGSPCQDLSVAGKRAGLKHEANGDEETTRSGLFMEAVRIIKEMRKATNGQYPRFALWENVPGAFSSNKGEDFRIVCEELIKVVEPSAFMPPVPQNGWNYSDSYIGDGWSLAYRVFDAQYWGVPQRRRRIHLVADFRGECAREILFEREGLRGYFAEGRTPWKTAPEDAQRGPGADDREGEGFDGYNGDLTGDKAATLGVNCGISSGRNGIVERRRQLEAVSVHLLQDPIVGEKVTPCLSLGNSTHGQACVGIAYRFDSLASNSMKSKNPHSGCREEPVVFNGENITSPTNAANPQPGDPCHTLGTDSRNYLVSPIFCLQGSMVGRADKNGPQGDGVNEDVAFTCNTIDRHAVCYRQGGFADYVEGEIGTLKASGGDLGGGSENLITAMLANGEEKADTLCAGPAARGFSGTQEIMRGSFHVIEPHPPCYIVRRLTPTECARLQGFADAWGHIEQKDNLTEEEYSFWFEVRNTHAAINGRECKEYTKAQMLTWYNKLYTDSAEYKMWGNGIALPPALYCMQGIADKLKAMEGI